MVYREVRRKKKLWQVTRRTINNYALRNKIRSFRAVKKPPLSGPNKLERVASAARLLKDEQLRDELIFSDEKLFQGGPSNRIQLVRRLMSKNNQHLAYEDRYVQRYMWSGGKGDIFCTENLDYFNEKGEKLADAPKTGKVPGFNSRSYTRMVEKLAIPSFNRRMVSYTSIQDNSPVHTSQ